MLDRLAGIFTSDKGRFAILTCIGTLRYYSGLLLVDAEHVRAQFPWPGMFHSSLVAVAFRLTYSHDLDKGNSAHILDKHIGVSCCNSWGCYVAVPGKQRCEVAV